MKRKYNDINTELTIKKVKYLKCDICSKRVYTYQLCTSPYTYCSIDCLSIIILSHQNAMLHEKEENTFEMKKVENHPDLMELDK